MLSIIIPCYNAAATLRRAVESVTCQQGLDCEIIIVNDGSADDTHNIIAQLAATDKRIIPIEKQNGGVSSARNAGFDRARGEYILYLDADDELDAAFAETVIPLITKQQPDVLLYAFDAENADGTRRKFSCTEHKDPISDYLLGKLRIHICSLIFRKSFANQASIRFDEKTYYSEDREYVVRLLRSQRSICYCNQVLFHYRYCASSAMHEPRYNAKYLTSLQAMERVLPLVADNANQADAAQVQLNLTILLHLRQYVRSKERDETLWPQLESYASQLHHRTRWRPNSYSLYVKIMSTIYRINRPLLYRTLKRF